MSKTQIGHLKSEADIQAYIEAALKDRDPVRMAAVLEDVKQAREALGLEKPPHPAEDEPFFITEEVEAEIIAAGDTPIEIPPFITTTNITEMFDHREGETLAEAIARSQASAQG